MSLPCCASGARCCGGDSPEACKAPCRDLPPVAEVGDGVAEGASRAAKRRLGLCTVRPAPSATAAPPRRFTASCAADHFVPVKCFTLASLSPASTGPLRCHKLKGLPWTGRRLCLCRLAPSSGVQRLVERLQRGRGTPWAATAPGDRVAVAGSFVACWHCSRPPHWPQATK